MRIIGIDPSLSRTGLAVICAASRTTRAYSLQTTKADPETIVSRLERSRRIAAFAMSYVNAETILAVIEGPALAARTPGVWDRAGLWWLIVSALTDAGVPVAVAAPTTRAKWATGKGNADKDSVGIAVDRMWRDVGRNNDERDALAFVTMGAQYVGWPVPTLARHLDAIKPVHWPATPSALLSVCVSLSLAGAQGYLGDPEPLNVGPRPLSAGPIGSGR